MINKQCRNCFTPLTEENSRSKGWKNGIYICKICAAEERRRYREGNRASMNNATKKWKEKNPDRTRRYRASWTAKNKERLTVQSATYYIDNRSEIRRKVREKAKTEKIAVLTYYGGGVLCCVRCGFDDARALSIDHIDGGGRAHRHSIGSSIYRWLITQHFPTGFQTLCMNCQFIKKAENQEVLQKSVP